MTHLDIPDKEEDSSDEEEDEDTDDEEPVKPDPKKVGQGKEAPAGNKKTPQKDTPPAKVHIFKILLAVIAKLLYQVVVTYIV